jgi:hypothetical protein
MVNMHNRKLILSKLPERGRIGGELIWGDSRKDLVRRSPLATSRSPIFIIADDGLLQGNHFDVTDARFWPI